MALTAALALSLSAVGLALPAESAQAATTIDIGQIQARVYDHVGTNEAGTSSVTEDNCISYDPRDGNKSTTLWRSSTTEVLTGHGWNGGCSNGSVSLNKTKQSAVGVQATSATSVQDGVAMPLAKIKHYNNPVNSASNWFKGKLGLKFDAFPGQDIEFPWTLWETPNSSSCKPSHQGSGWGTPRWAPSYSNCLDEINFTSQVADKILSKDGIDYRLIISGFEKTDAQTCPATPTGNTQNQFLTDEDSITSACIYGYFQQVRKLSVDKTIVGDPATTKDFAFTSAGSLDGSPWRNGNSTVRPTTTDRTKNVFNNEVYRSDAVTVTETTKDDRFWKLTGATCTEMDANGKPVSLPSSQFTFDAGKRSISLKNVGAPKNPKQPNISCNFTNTYADGSIIVKKVVQAPEGAYTGGNSKNFSVTLTCGNDVTQTKNVQWNAEGVKFSGLPTDQACNIRETKPTGDLANSSYYWGEPTYQPGSATPSIENPPVMTVTNTVHQQTGKLNVTKTVTPEATTPETPSDGFTGGVNRKFELKYTCSLDGKKFPGSDGSVMVTTGKTILSDVLPAGAVCDLSEAKPVLDEGDFVDESFEWLDGKVTPGQVVVKNNETISVLVENKFKRSFSSMTIQKIVDPTVGVAADHEFSGKYVCGADDGKFDGTWKLKAGESKAIDGLPIGISCQVTEDALDNSKGLTDGSWQWNTPSFSSQPVKVSKDGKAKITVTNSAQQQFGSFTVKKTVSGPDSGYIGSNSRTFDVGYTCTIPGGQDITGLLKIADGATSAKVVVPAGYACALSEDLKQKDGDFADPSFEWVGGSFDANNLMIEKNKTSAATLTNKFTRNYSDIKVNKIVEGAGYKGGDAKNFTVLYNCGNGEETLNVANGGSGLIKNVPVGSACSLNEKAPSAELLDAAHEWVTPPTWTGLNESGHIVAIKGKTAEATVTNKTVPVFGALSVTKKLDGNGVIAGTTFPINVTCDNGFKETFELAAGASATTGDLPVGTSCDVVETAPSGQDGLIDDSYSWGSAPAKQTVKISTKNKTVAIEVLNTTVRNKGQLSVTKNLDDRDGVVASGRSFTGTWSCVYGNDAPVKGPWSLAAGQTKIVTTDILLGSTCTVTEDNLSAPSDDSSYMWAGVSLSPNNGVVGVTLKDKSANVTVKNTVKRLTGSFGVSKTVVGEGSPANAKFNFDWTCSATGWKGDSGSFSLENKGVWSAPVIPADAACTVTETSNPPTSGPSYTWDSLAWAVTGANKTVNDRSVSFTIPQPTVVEGQEVPAQVAVAATNTVSKKFGSVQIRKELTGATAGLADKNFEFTVNATCGDAGSFSTKVKAGQTSTIDGIPLGSDCDVAETEGRGELVDDSYSWGGVTIAPESFQIVSDKQLVTISVKNEIKRVYGDVKVQKILVGPTGVVNDRDFSGAWTCQYPGDQPVTGEWNVKAGQTTPELSGQKVLIGSVCTATENKLEAPSSDPSYHWLATKIDPATVAPGVPAVIKVTNTFERQTSDVLVKKTLSGATEGYTGGDAKAFQINYVCSTPGATEKYTGSVQIAAGAAATSLFANHAAGIPAGWDCNVSESSAASTAGDKLADGSFTWGESTVTPDKFTVGDKDVKVIAVNNKIDRVYTPVTLEKVLTGETTVVDPKKEYSGTWVCTYGTGDSKIEQNGKWVTTAGAPSITLGDKVLVGSECIATEDTDKLGSAAQNGDPSYRWEAPKVTPVTTTAAGGKVLVTNKVTRDLGSVAVTKKITGSTDGYLGDKTDPKATFTVNYTCQAPGIPALQGSVAVANGATETIDNVPFGWECSFAESTPSNDLLIADGSFAWAAAKIDPATVTLDKKHSKAAIVVENPIQRVYTDVKIQKVLNDEFRVVDPNRKYSGTVACTYGDTSITGEWEKIAGAEASSVVFDKDAKLLVGSDCVVTENNLGAPSLDPSFVFAAPEFTSLEGIGVEGGTLVVTNAVKRNLGNIEINKTLVDPDGGFTGADNKVFAVDYVCTSPVNGVDPLTGKLMLAAGGSATAENVPFGWECEFTEVDPEGNLKDASFAWGTPAIEGGVVTLDKKQPSATVKVTNTVTRELGALEISKQIAGEHAEVVDADITFTGTWTCAYGDTPRTGEWSMKAGESVVVADDVFVGSDCSVEENPTVKKPTVKDASFTWLEATIEGAPAKIEANETAHVGVVNSIGRDLGKLNVTKKLSGAIEGFNGADKEAFTATYVCTNPLDKKAKPLSGEVLLAANGTKSIESIPFGWDCVVDEKDASGNLIDASYVWGTPVIAPEKISMGEAANDSTVTVTNPIERDFKAVNVEKKEHNTKQNDDGTWTIGYTITVTNPVNAESLYSLTDTLTYGKGLTPESARFKGPGEPADWKTWEDLGKPAQLATNQIIGASTGENSKHVYEVEVIASVAQGIINNENSTAICEENGGTKGGGFLNKATVTVGENSATDSDCSEPTQPEFSKTWRATSQDDAANWNVSYDLTVNNKGGHESVYSLVDAPAFAEGVTINSWTVSDPDENVIIDAQPFTDGKIIENAVIEADGTHTYKVRFNVAVASTVSEENATCGEGEGSAGKGFFNKATLSSGNDSQADQDCSEIVEGGTPAISKTVTSTTQDANGNWNVSYKIVVDSESDLVTRYDLNDTLRFGAGMDINSATWKGPKAEGTWDLEKSNVATLAKGELLEAGNAIHTYEVNVNVTVPMKLIGTEAADCKLSETEKGTGFLNTATLVSGKTTLSDDACATPTKALIEKQALGVEQQENGSWNVAYLLNVDNTDGHAGVYSLSDIPAFSKGVSINNWSVQAADEDTPSIDLVEQAYADGVIRTDQDIDANAKHSYRVTFNVEVALADSIENATCGAEGGEAGNGFFNTAELAVGNDKTEDSDCVEVPKVGAPTVEKTATGTNQDADGNWVVSYQIQVKATGENTSKYTLEDTLAYGDGATILEAAWAGPGEGESGTWENPNEQRTAALATDRLIKPGTTDIYTVNVVASVAKGATGTPSMDCKIGEGEDGKTGFLNTVKLGNAGTTIGTDDACSTPAAPIFDKQAGELVQHEDAEGNWDGTWDASYTLRVTNPATEGQQVNYELSDTPAFAKGVIVNDRNVSSDDVAVNEGWHGKDSTDDVIISGQVLDAGATHNFNVIINVSLTADINDADRVCAAEGTEGGNGLLNTGTVNSGNESSTDDACLEIPAPSSNVVKTAVSSEENADGSWDIHYTVVVNNTSDVAARYDLADTLRFGAGITATNANWSLEGTEEAGNWENPGTEPSTVLAKGRDLEARDSHTYLVHVVANLEDGVIGSEAGTCQTEDSETNGGFLNEATLVANGKTSASRDCLAPEKNPRGYSMVKTADPSNGTVMWPGEDINYTITVRNTGEFVYPDAVVTDEMAGWQQAATLKEGSLKLSGGESVIEGSKLIWTVGELEVGESKTLTYTITVNDEAWDQMLVNVATGSGDVPPSKTTHPTPEYHKLPEPPVVIVPPVVPTPEPVLPGTETKVPPRKPVPPLASTGASNATLWIVGSGALVLLLGTGFMMVARRRKSEQN